MPMQMRLRIAQQFIIRFSGQKGAINRLGHDGHFIEKSKPDVRLQVMKLRDVILVKEQRVAFPILEVAQNNVACGKLRDEQRILASADSAYAITNEAW